MDTTTMIPSSRWRTAAACIGEPAETFFDPRLAEWAKRICLRCPVMEDCRRDAAANAIAFGVWGGWTADERRRGRPAEADPVGHDRRGFVTPTCATCASGLAWPLAARPSHHLSEGRMVAQLIDGEEWTTVHHDDLRFPVADDGRLRCPGCDADLGHLDDGGAHLRPGAVAFEDTRLRRRRMQGVT